MLSILIPNHNEKGINRLIEVIEKRLPAFEIIIARDRDGHGKGWALREAMLQARGDEIAFLDGDGDIEPRMLLRLLPFLEDYDAVVGSKRICHKSWFRRMITIASRIYIRILFGLQEDTQTGIKLFRKSMLHYWKSNGFIYDVELLYKLKKDGGRIIEVPIEAEIKASLSLKALWKTFAESIALKFRL